MVYMLFRIVRLYVVVSDYLMCGMVAFCSLVFSPLVLYPLGDSQQRWRVRCCERVSECRGVVIILSSIVGFIIIIIIICSIVVQLFVILFLADENCLFIMLVGWVMDKAVTIVHPFNLLFCVVLCEYVCHCC